MITHRNAVVHRDQDGANCMSTGSPAGRTGAPVRLMRE